jgi:serine/threonine-protein kinase RsbW
MAEPNGATSGPVRVSVSNDRDSIARVEADLLARVESFEYPKASVFAIKLAFEEAITNAFKHGHSAVAGDQPVEVEYAVDADEVTIGVEDRGPGFDLGSIPDPTLDENLTVPSGRGLMLIRSYMTEVRHNQRGNRVEMVYRRARR